MATGHWSSAIRRVERLWTHGTAAGQSESELLGLYLGGDEAAFEALVARHGPMVHAVCRRALGNRHDADDAFQATFIVLARKAGSVRRGEPLEGWLYGVARKVAARARSVDESRRRREARRGEAGDGGPDPARQAQRLEAAEIVQSEVDRLPAAGRAVVVLCDLAGCSHEEAAARLGLPLGTVKSRHSRARALLMDRLRGRGLAPAPALASIDDGAGIAPVPPALLKATAAAACAYAAGRAAVAGLTSTHASSLANGVLTAMLVNHFKVAAVATLAAAVFTAGAAAFAQIGPGTPAPAPIPGATAIPQPEPGGENPPQIEEGAERPPGAIKKGTDRRAAAKRSNAAANQQGQGGMFGRGGEGGFGGFGGEITPIPEVGDDPASQATATQLEAAITMQFPNETPLEDILKYVKATMAKDPKAKPLRIYVDPEGLAAAEKTPTSPVTLDLEDVPLRTSLKLALHQLGLTYFVRDGLILVTAPDCVQGLDDAISGQGFVRRPGASNMARPGGNPQ
jgi:RNA polymerase sigma factor (sigma-70 family)